MIVDLHTLAGRISIEECLYHYSHLVDTQQYHRIAEEIFTPDASVDMGEALAVGRDAINRMCLAYQGLLLGSSHVVSNLVIKIDGDEAEAVSRVTAWHWFADPDGDPFRPSEMVAIGAYEDRLRRTANNWRIARRRCLNFGTGVGSGRAPDFMRQTLTAMRGRVSAWPH